MASKEDPLVSADDGGDAEDSDSAIKRSVADGDDLEAAGAEGSDRPATMPSASGTLAGGRDSPQAKIASSNSSIKPGATIPSPLLEKAAPLDDAESTLAAAVRVPLPVEGRDEDVLDSIAPTNTKEENERAVSPAPIPALASIVSPPPRTSSLPPSPRRQSALASSPNTSGSSPKITPGPFHSPTTWKFSVSTPPTPKSPPLPPGLDPSGPVPKRRASSGVYTPPTYPGPLGGARRNSSIPNETGQPSQPASPAMQRKSSGFYLGLGFSSLSSATPAGGATPPSILTPSPSTAAAPGVLTRGRSYFASLSPASSFFSSPNTASPTISTPSPISSPLTGSLSVSGVYTPATFYSSQQVRSPSMCRSVSGPSGPFLASPMSDFPMSSFAASSTPPVAPTLAIPRKPAPAWKPIPVYSGTPSPDDAEASMSVSGSSEASAEHDSGSTPATPPVGAWAPPMALETTTSASPASAQTSSSWWGRGAGVGGKTMRVVEVSEDGLGKGDSGRVF